MQYHGVPRLCRLVIVLGILFIVLLAAVRFIGGRRPSPLMAMFTNPDGSACQQPCIYGIHPGVTRIADGIAILKSHPALRDLKVLIPEPFLMGNLETGPLITFSKTPDGRIDTLVISDPGASSGSEDTKATRALPGSILLGDTLSALGVPDWMIVHGGFFYANYLYGDAKMDFVTPIGSQRERIDPEESASSLIFYSYIPCTSDILSNPFTHWLGFTSVERYEDLAKTTIWLRWMTLPDPAICIHSGSS